MCRFFVISILLIHLCTVDLIAQPRETYRTRIAKSLTMDSLMKKVEEGQPGELRAMFTSSGEFLKNTVGNTGLVVDVLTLGTHDELLDHFAGGVNMLDDSKKPFNAKSALGDTAFYLTVAVDLLKAKDAKQVNKAFHDAFLEWGYGKATDAASKVFGGLVVLPANLVKWFLGEVKTTVDVGIEQRLWKQYTGCCKDLLENTKAGRLHVGRMIVNGSLDDELLRRFDEDMFFNTATKGIAGFGAVELTKRHRLAFRDKFLLENKAHFENAAVEELHKRVKDAMPLLKRSAATRLKEARSIFDKRAYFILKPVDKETQKPITSSFRWYLEANLDEKGSAATVRASDIAKITISSCKDVYTGPTDEVVFFLVARGYKRKKISVPLNWKEALNRKKGQDIGVIEFEPSASALLDVTVTSNSPKSGDYFTCILGAQRSATLEKDAKAGKFSFRAEPGKYFLVAGDSKHAATTKEIELKKGNNSLDIELKRLSPYCFDRPVKASLPKNLSIPSPLTAMNEVSGYLNELSTSGGTLQDLESLCEEANSLVSKVKKTLDPHFEGRYFAQANNWLSSGKPGENRYPKYNTWYQKYTKESETLLANLQQKVVQLEADTSSARSELATIINKANRLQNQFRKPDIWSSIRPFYIDVDEVEAADVSQFKASVEAELAEISVSPSAMTIYEMRRIAQSNNPFQSRKENAAQKLQKGQEEAQKAQKAYEQLEILRTALDELVSGKGCLLLNPSITKRSIPHSISYLRSKWTSYKGKSEPLTIEARLSSSSLMETAKEIGFLSQEGKAISLYYKTELEPRESLHNIYLNAYQAWAQWKERVLAQLAIDEAEEARVQAELENLSKELEAAFKELEKARSELQVQRNKSQTAIYELDRMKSSPKDLEVQQRARAAANNTPLQEKAIADSTKALSVVNKLQTLNYKIMRFTQHPLYGATKRPQLPSSFYGTNKNHYYNRVSTVKKMASKTRSNVKTLKTASAKMADSEQDMKKNEARVKQLLSEINSAVASLEKKAASATNLDGIAREYTKSFMNETYASLKTQVAAVRSGKMVVSNELRRAAGTLDSKLQQVDYFVNRGLGGLTRRWYENFAKDYKQKKVAHITQRLHSRWNCAGKSSPSEQQAMLARYFKENDFGTVTFKLKSWKKTSTHKLETVYDVVITGQTRPAAGQIYKLGTIEDTLALTENGVRIVRTSKACWALVKKMMAFSQLHLGFGLLGRLGTYRYVTQSQLQNDGLVLAGIANGKDLSIKSLGVSTDGGRSYQKMPFQSHGNRALFHGTIKLSPGKDLRLVLKGSTDGKIFVNWPPSGAFLVRCTKKTTDETIALLTRHMFKAWNEMKVEDVLAVFSTNYYGGFSKLSAVLRNEIKAGQKTNLVTLAIGSAGPWRRVKTEWKDRIGRAHTSYLYFNHALRIVDIRGPLPFGQSDAKLVQAANFPIGKRVLRGRLTLDYSQQMCERDQLLMGALFRHGLAIPCTSVKTATTDIVLRHPMIIFAIKGAIADGREKPLHEMKTLPNEGWTHALFRKEEKASFYVGCKSKRWVSGKIDQIKMSEDEGQVILRYNYYDNAVFEKK